MDGVEGVCVCNPAYHDRQRAANTVKKSDKEILR
jgi:hypothetical protein